jgi:hypothetical protein
MKNMNKLNVGDTFTKHIPIGFATVEPKKIVILEITPKSYICHLVLNSNITIQKKYIFDDLVAKVK